MSRSLGSTRPPSITELSELSYETSVTCLLCVLQIRVHWGMLAPRGFLEEASPQLSGLACCVTLGQSLFSSPLQTSVRSPCWQFRKVQPLASLLQPLSSHPQEQTQQFCPLTWERFIFPLTVQAPLFHEISDFILLVPSPGPPRAPEGQPDP